MVLVRTFVLIVGICVAVWHAEIQIQVHVDVDREEVVVTVLLTCRLSPPIRGVFRLHHPDAALRLLLHVRTRLKVSLVKVMVPI